MIILSAKARGTIQLCLPKDGGAISPIVVCSVIFGYVDRGWLSVDPLYVLSGNYVPCYFFDQII